MRRNVLEVATDYLAVGIDPSVTTICVQSALPALAELTLLYLNFVTVARLERNPTIKDEIQARGFGRDIPAGFLCDLVARTRRLASGIGWRRRLFPDLTSDAHLAFQAEPGPPSPYSKAEAPGHELARV